MTTHRKWLRVNKHRPCQICGHDHWCLRSVDGTAAICPRVESAHRAGEGGWLHGLVHVERFARAPRCQTWHFRPCSEVQDHTRTAAIYQAAGGNRDRIERLAHALHVSVESLRRLGVGYMQAQNATTWPLYEADCRRVRGINRRFSDDSKKIVHGHHAGIYAPSDLPADLSKTTLLIVEGGSDVAAALDLGFWAVGRFSCTHGASLLVRLIRQRKPDVVVVCADAGNEHERRGAECLAADLVPYCGALKVIAPPPPQKDLRAWLIAGATHSSIQAAIDAASLCHLKVRINAHGRY